MPDAQTPIAPRHTTSIHGAVANPAQIDAVT